MTTYVDQSQFDLYSAWKISECWIWMCGWRIISIVGEDCSSISWCRRVAFSCSYDERRERMWKESALRRNPTMGRDTCGDSTAITIQHEMASSATYKTFKRDDLMNNDTSAHDNGYLSSSSLSHLYHVLRFTTITQHSKCPHDLWEVYVLPWCPFYYSFPWYCLQPERLQSVNFHCWPFDLQLS